MKRGDKEVPAVYFNVYKNDNVTGNGPTHQWLKWENREEIVIPKGIYSVKFFPKSQTNENQGNLKIEKFKDKPRQDKEYGTRFFDVKTQKPLSKQYNLKIFLEDSKIFVL